MPDEREVAKVAVSPEWRTSINYAILTLLHLIACGFVTFLLLLLLPKASQPPIERDPSPIPVPHEENRDARVVRIWATAMGLLSTVLALFQYLVGISILSEIPQTVHADFSYHLSSRKSLELGAESLSDRSVYQ